MIVIVVIISLVCWFVSSLGRNWVLSSSDKISQQSAVYGVCLYTSWSFSVCINLIVDILHEQFTCQTNSVSRTIRYCGATNKTNLSFKPCSRVLMRFFSDRSVVGQGFFVSYNITPISKYEFLPIILSSFLSLSLYVCLCLHLSLSLSLSVSIFALCQ